MRLRFEKLWLPTGIEPDVTVRVADDGTIAAIGEAATSGAAAVTTVAGLAIAGLPNVHSHAFQRGFAGRAEVAQSAPGTFWSWRDVMYRFTDLLTPEDVHDIAAYAYVEMAEAGYSSVAEFHYLHHDPRGRAYAPPAAMAAAVRAGARTAGLRQLLLPCLYQTRDFGATDALPAQRRFTCDVEQLARLAEDLRAGDDALFTSGIALHSLRAVPVAAIRALLAAVPAGRPVHIHVAEQRREVEACVAFSGRRPIEYLCEHAPVDRHWCLVHATHATDDELRLFSERGAVVGLCPTTEANLGDGYLALDRLLAAGGRFGIGSDSHVSLDPREELRLAEYLLRTAHERRNVLADATQPHTGTRLYALALEGGAQAMGFAAGGIRVGAPADFVVLDTSHPALAGCRDEEIVDTYLFAPRVGMLRDHLIGGRWIVRDGQHHERERLGARYRATIQTLRDRL